MAEKELLPEKWMRGVAVTTTVLAVCASIAGSRGTAAVTQTQLLTSKEGSAWAYYQAKSIKQNLAEVQQKTFSVDLSQTEDAQKKSVLVREVERQGEEVARYGQEKEEIRKKAESLGEENAIMGRRGSQFSLAVVFFQIGVMLSSVAALLKRKSMWAVGLIFGAVGLVFLANGFLLLF
jgi:Flp pilus assembly protein TadB